MHRRSQNESRALNLSRGSGQSATRSAVLFVCVANAGRSRMAEALFNDLARGRYLAASAGTRPARRPHPEVAAAMAEIGLPLEDLPGTLITAEAAESALRVISMGCNVRDACPAATMNLQEWELDDPKGRSPQEVARIRDEIETKVRNLIAALDRELG